MIKFFTLGFLVFNSTVYAAEYKNAFAIFCKSYHEHLDKSIFMYKSVEDYATESYPFYMIVPAKEIALFKKAFFESKFKKMPEFLTEEEILKKCGIFDKIYDDVPAIQNGWRIQQMVKLCIHKTMLAKDYLTLDSDTYFVKNFDKSIFYHNKTLKTVGVKIANNQNKAIKELHFENNSSESSQKYNVYSYIRYLFKPNKTIDNWPWYDFISSYALWSSDIVAEMVNNLYNSMHFDIKDMIKIAPWEGLWYGQFIQTYYPDKLYLMPKNFITILGYRNAELKYWFCTPTKGYKGTYLMAKNEDVLTKNKDEPEIYEMPATFWCKIRNFFRLQ